MGETPPAVHADAGDGTARPAPPRRPLGTSLLVAAVVGSGVAARSLSPLDVGLQLLENSTATVLGLAVLILVMGCGDTCPVFPGKRYIDWDLEDPAGEGIETVRRVRDEIKLRIEGLVAELVATK